ncbi:MAG: hypothetical protein K1X72_08070 [Pyrinomonadaceae bacterium]|nr:hypothetical protein [Pyrinomonadaceae bacterium]
MKNKLFIALTLTICLLMFGCGQSNNAVNSNTTANTNKATNSNSANTNTANSNTANTNSANSNTTVAKSIKDEILGTWIQGESGSAKIKMVITKDEMTKFDNDKQEDVYKYTWLNDKEIEVDFKGQKLPAKVTIKGDEMTLDIKELGPVPYKRESANTTKTTDSASKDKDGGAEPKADCQVKTDNANLYVEATNKDIKLKKGTPISWTIPDMHQGIIVVKAKVGNEWIQGEILLDDTTCN